MGDVEFEAGAGRREFPDIDRAVADLDRRPGQEPVWFTEDVIPGQWVQFEAPMAYTTFGTTAVFLDVDQPTDLYPSGGERRLVLHGGARHLVGTGSAPRTSVEQLSVEAAEHSSVSAEAFESLLWHFDHLIRAVSEQDIEGRDSDSVHSYNRQLGASGLAHVLPTLTCHVHLPHAAVRFTPGSGHRVSRTHRPAERMSSCLLASAGPT
ncbi:SAVMC3_10250 family protein, partial [Amycolatopsis sp. NPDC051371]|uniref:SAVMC3_10250 family protein n=1 Tax=Amycolatopsis sp. NPDC051371 TaxID=3155800 RepID=UPI00343C3860